MVSRWGHRLLVAHQRNSVFSELRQSLLDRIHSTICSTPSSILRRCNPSDEGWPTCIVASRRRRNEMTSRDWQLAHQRLPYRAGITAVPTSNPEGPRRRDDEPMMKLRRRKPIVCDRVDKNGASQAQSKDHTSSPSARPARRGQRCQRLPKDKEGGERNDLQHQSPQ